MSHEMPFKKLIWKFSWEAYSRKYSQKFSRVSLTRELLAKQPRNSLSKVEKLEILTFKLPIEFTHEMGHENTQKTCFSHKNNLKNVSDTNHFQKQTKRTKKLFGLMHIWLSTHTSHLNMYNYTNELDIHWTLNMRVVCVNQVWNSP